MVRTFQDSTGSWLPIESYSHADTRVVLVGDWIKRRKSRPPIPNQF